MYQILAFFVYYSIVSNNQPSRYCSAYENTNEEDLWNTLEEQASIDGVILPANLVKIMGSWTQNKNFPWIKVTRDYSGSIDGALVEQVGADTLIQCHHYVNEVDDIFNGRVLTLAPICDTGN